MEETKHFHHSFPILSLSFPYSRLLFKYVNNQLTIDTSRPVNVLDMETIRL